MPDSPSKYAENQFDTATRDNPSLMEDVLADAKTKLTAVIATLGSSGGVFSTVLTVIDNLLTSWESGESDQTNVRASIDSATSVFEDKIASMQRKPDLDNNSPIETWDSTIRATVAYGGSVYQTLLPNGRETVTAGTYEGRLDALRDFALRLGQQTTHPALVTLGTSVGTFHTAARTVFNDRATLRGTLGTLGTAQEALRVEAAEELFAMVATAMIFWKKTPRLVDTVYDVNLLRQPPQSIPEAPTDLVWTPATRTLATTTLPAGATRLTAWRLSEGGAPERLATGERDALGVVIPVSITWPPGDTWQLWLTARNSRGDSEPSPVQTWTAPV